MKRILLVEDEQALARHLTRLLQAEGFTVVHAATQRAAAACLEETPLDLALVDISLPDGNGFAVCTAIKQAQAIPVLFLTASADEDSVVTGLCLGGDDYITKPFRPRELLARITAALRKSGRAPLGLFPPWPDGGHRQRHGAKAGAGGVSLPSGVPPAADLPQ